MPDLRMRENREWREGGGRRSGGKGVVGGLEVGATEEGGVEVEEEVVVVIGSGGRGDKRKA